VEVLEMASNNYDDLLESFMNNSEKVYDEDEHKRAENNVPNFYSVSNPDKKSSKVQRGRQIEQKLAQKKKRKKKKKKTPAQESFSVIGKILLGMIMIVGVVGIVCFSVIAIYGYSVVYGDPVFDLTEEKFSQNQTSFIYGTDGDDEVEIT